MPKNSVIIIIIMPVFWNQETGGSVGSAFNFRITNA